METFEVPAESPEAEMRRSAVADVSLVPSEKPLAGN